MNFHSQIISSSFSELWAGLEIPSSVFWMICSFFVIERAIRSRKRGNCSCRSFVMSDLSKLLTVALLSWVTSVNRSLFLFLKKPMSEQRRELFALGHKKEEKLSKTDKKSHHSSHNYSWKWTILSERAKSEWANSQPWLWALNLKNEQTTLVAIKKQGFFNVLR